MLFSASKIPHNVSDNTSGNVELVTESNSTCSTASCRVDGSPTALTRLPSTLSINLPIADLPIAGPLSVTTLSIEPSAVGVMLIISLFSLLLASFGIKIYRLTSLVRRRDQRINALLTVDPVTALHNRNRFRQMGEALLRTTPLAAIALLSIRLDDLNAIRSELGDQTSDELLRQIAHRLQTCAEPLDVLARTGEDEFSLLISTKSASNNCSVDAQSRVDAQDIAARNVDTQDIDTRNGALKIAKRMLSVTHQPFYIRAQKIKLESSIGIALVDTILSEPNQSCVVPAPLSGRDFSSKDFSSKDCFDRLLLEASIALLQVRTQLVGAERGRYAVFSLEMEVTRAVQAQQRQALKAALVRKEMCVRYQPIVDLETSDAVGFEALVRWQHPQLGLIGPHEFLPLAESMGLVVEIDRWMLETACQQLSNWRDKRLYPFISVNLSGEHLSCLDLVETVETLLLRYGVAPSQLRVEVTESVVIADSEQAIATLNRLKRMGLRVSLDDFGTGYCSFGYLSQFPVDVLKIDKSFVKGLEQPERVRTNKAIVRSILALAEDLGISVVAEGIEHLEQHQWLRQMGCRYGQGNLFAVALTERSAQALLIARLITTK